jgi:hypothetical protein
MSTINRVLKWTGGAALVLGVLPLTAVLVREIPGMIREVKIARMGFVGGWKQAH